MNLINPQKKFHIIVGHLAAASDRKRDSKDAYLTFLTSNVIPQSSKSNAGDSPWNALEEYTQKLAKSGKDIYITAGGLKAIAPPLLNTDQPLTGIEIPTHSWKLIFVLKQSGLSISDIQKNPDYIEEAIAVVIPNVELDTTFPNTFPIPAYPFQIQINNQEEWKDWQNWRVSFRELQEVTDLKFFLGLNSKTRDIIQNKSLKPIVLSSFLLADTQLADHSSTIVGANKSSSVGHDGVVVEGSVSHQDSLETVSRDRAFKISSNQNSEIQVNTLHPSVIQTSIRQISPLQVGTTEVSFSQGSTLQVSISQVGTLQVSTAQTYASQISSFEKGTTEIGSHQPRSHQVDSYQVGPSQVSFYETNTRQFSSSQVNTFEINSGKIPLSSRISPEQFLSIHHSTPKSIYTINNSVLAPSNSPALLNGDFDITNSNDPDYSWNRRGAATIENSKAILTEDSPFNSNFSQTFTIPSEAKTLQFTLTNTQLGHSAGTPPDAFEVALLDANTLIPLVGTNTGLNQTDSSFNLQGDGTSYFSDSVKVNNATPSGQTISFDISHLTPGTTATLYFDLLGFGERDSRIEIDRIRILSSNQLAPIANNDTASNPQGSPITLNATNA